MNDTQKRGLSRQSSKFLGLISLGLGILSLPFVWLPLVGLEYKVYLIDYIVLSITSLTLIVLGILYYRGSEKVAGKDVISLILIFLLLFLTLEFTGRLVVKYALSTMNKGKVIEFSTYGDKNYGRITGHPFLQFTGRVGFKQWGGHRADDYGFTGVSYADLPKPPGIIRVACLGGSTTQDGYPAMLEEHLNREGGGRRFQVLNFGLAYYTSAHSVVNYVLNVRDFSPDFVVIHHNCNDALPRGYKNFRPDYAHVLKSWDYQGEPDVFMIRYSIYYRFIRAYLLPKFNIGNIPFAKATEKRDGKKGAYQPEELQTFKRNIKTIVTLADEEKHIVIITTQPRSRVRKYSERGAPAYNQHIDSTNELLRQFARENSLPLVDLDQLMTGREEYFWDPVHVVDQGNDLKAAKICKTILSLVNVKTP
jgi:lysophospholipase L1-like esterase